jgi:hypothetical protein
MRLKGASIGLLSVIIILGLIGVAFRQQGGTVWPDEAVAAQGAAVKEAEPAAAVPAPATAAADEKCPAFTITSEVTPGKVTFSAAPARGGLSYSWSVSAGTVTSGSGTDKIIVDVSSAPTKEVIASLDVLGLDPACPKDAGYATATAQLP